jgi:hypothetical protein
MNLSSRLAGLVALAMLAVPTSVSADIGQFIGTWENVRSTDPGIVRITIAQQGGSVSVRVFGQCTPTACDWGQVSGTLYGSGVQSQLPQQTLVIRAEFNQSFARRQLIIHLSSGNQLRVEVFTQFTDTSGRASYFDSDLFKKAAAAEDCIPFNPTTVSAALVQGNWKLVSGNMWMLDFGNKQDEAKKAEAIVKHYQFNRQCFVGRPPSFTYWLVGNHSGAGGIPGDDCVTFDPATVEAKLDGGMWKMVDGNHLMFSFPSQAEAQQAVQIVKQFGFTHSCFVGRPGPSMSYQRK